MLPSSWRQVGQWLCTLSLQFEQRVWPFGHCKRQLRINNPRRYFSSYNNKRKVNIRLLMLTNKFWMLIIIWQQLQQIKNKRDDFLLNCNALSKWRATFNIWKRGEQAGVGGYQKKWIFFTTIWPTRITYYLTTITFWKNMIKAYHSVG